jgi:hypothetical protein
MPAVTGAILARIETRWPRFRIAGQGGAKRAKLAANTVWVRRMAGPVWVNRVDPAMSVTCPLYPQLLSNWCGAAKRRDVPGADI